MADQADNQALVTRIQRGDREALGELLEREQGRLYNVVLRMVGRSDDAMEVTQQAMLAVIEHIDGFKAQSAVTTWMTRIAMNAALTHLRRERVRRTASLDAPGNGQYEDAGSPADRLTDHREPPPGQRIEMEETAALVARALAGVDEDHRAVLVLRDIDGLDYARIAAVLDAPVGTIKSRLFRARLALRAELVRLERPRESGERGPAQSPDGEQGIPAPSERT